METTELVTIKANQLSAKAFSIDVDKIKEAVQEYAVLVIEGPGDRAGMKRVREGRLALRKVRTSIEARRKELKADSMAYGKRVDEIARELTALVEPTEELLDGRETAVTQEVERLAAAKLKDRMDQLAEYRSVIPASTIAGMDDATFAECLEWSRKNYEDARAAEKLVADAEAKRLAEEAAAKAEEARAIAESRAELERKQETFRVEQAEANRKLKEQQDKIDAENARLEAIHKKTEADAAAQRRQQELERAKIEAAEQARKDEIARQERQLVMDQEAADAAIAEAARREALKPDREKLRAFVTAVLTIPVPDVTESSRPILTAITEDLIELCEKSRDLIETM